MTLGELKIACYKLIDPSDEAVQVENISEVYEKDTSYSFYFLNMLNSINSAITRIVQACILPLKKLEIDCKTVYEPNKRKIMIDLKKIADDIYKIKHIEYQSKNGESCKMDYRLIGNFLEFLQKENGSIAVYYFPKIKNLEVCFKNQKQTEDMNQLDLNEIGLDDGILSMIPYFVKADLLEHDKPTEAVLARNTFEQYLASFESPEIEIKKTNQSWWRVLL